MGNEYLAVLKATYDYEPQSEDEIAIKENQLLFLLDKSDDECVRLWPDRGTAHGLTYCRPAGGRSGSRPTRRMMRVRLASSRPPTSSPCVD